MKKLNNVNEYITSFPKDIQTILEKIRATIKKEVPYAEESISYAMPGYKLNGIPLVYFAAYKNHIGFYATPSGHKEFEKELAKYKQGKGSVQFPIKEKIPFVLITRIVKFKAKENIKKSEQKKPKISKGKSEVSDFLKNLKHPMKKEIELIRKIILQANKNLTEVIKWNAPSFCHKGEDRITMRIQPPKQIQIIFHRGAKVLQQPKEKLIQEDLGLLVWKENDRAVATFTNEKEIVTKKKGLAEIVNKWIKATESISK